MAKILKSSFLLMLGLFLFFGFQLSLWAETTDSKTYKRELGAAITEVKEEDATAVTWSSFVRYMPSRSVSAVSGKVGITEAESEFDYEFNLFKKLPIELAIDTVYIGIDNTTPVELPAHLTGVTFDLDTTLPFFKFNNTYLRVGISPAFYTDDWNFTPSAFRIPMRSFLIYQPSNMWTFLAGIAVYPDFGNKVLPVLGFIYKPNDKLIFNIIPKEPSINYLLNDRVTLFAKDGSLFNSEFEVTKDNLENVVLRYEETRLAGGVKYKLNKYVESSLAAGTVFNRQLKYRDSLGKVELRSGCFLEFRVDVRI